MMRKIWILNAISNIEVSNHDEYVIYVDFSTLKILQSQLREVWINNNHKIRQSTIEKGNARNNPIVKYILLKIKPKRRHSDINIDYDFR